MTAIGVNTATITITAIYTHVDHGINNIDSNNTVQLLMIYVIARQVVSFAADHYDVHGAEKAIKVAAETSWGRAHI